MDAAHICVVQPGKALSALPYLDHALYLQRMLTHLGITTSIGKNRLQADRINLVLASHLGVDLEAFQLYPCILINLERLQDGTHETMSRYLELLRATPVAEANPLQAELYANRGRAVPLIPLACGLPAATRRLENRSIGLLFQGPVNARTLPLLTQIERQGVSIARLDEMIHGPERQLLVANARAVLQLLDRDDAGFDLRAAAPTWWAGTPLVAERPQAAAGDTRYQRGVHWFGADEIPDFFGKFFATPAFAQQAAQSLAALGDEDPRAGFGPLLALANEVMHTHPGAPPATRINARMRETGYRPGWLNLGPHAEDAPDMVLNLLSQTGLPPVLQMRSGTFELIRGSIVEPGSDAARALFDKALQLLKPGGLLTVALPCRAATGPLAQTQTATAWAEASLADVTDRFWHNGWLTHRFEVRHAAWLDAQGMPVPVDDTSPTSAARAAAGPSVAARVVLCKVESNYLERAVARASRQDFGLSPHTPLLA